MSNLSKADVAVIILTYNEEVNLHQALASVVGWAREVFVLDSFSNDRTVAIANEAGVPVVQNAFVGYATQRNFALDNLPIQSTWVLFLDADEWLPADLKAEISARLSANPFEDGFYLKRRLIWMGRWIKHGYYPVSLLRLFRHGKGRCEAREINEHILVEGPVSTLENDMIHEDHKSVTEWIAKHNRYATAEAKELFKTERTNELEGKLLGSEPERKRWIRQRVWSRLPPFVRPAAYFGYRYVIRGGFLDGPEAFAFHVLQGLWFHTLIDVKYLELERGSTK